VRRWALLAVLLYICATIVDSSSSSVEPESEADRIRAHLTSVLAELRSAPPRDLTPGQQRARAETLRWLEEYRDRGVFPHNHLPTGGRVPVFVDPHGTPCAVGYLLLRSGEQDLVREVVETDNLVRVPELRDEARVAGWLEDRGLTLAEAARIQPTYGPRDPDFGESGYGTETVSTSVVTAAVTAFALAVEKDTDRTDWIGWAAVGTGLAHSGFLAASLVEDEVPAWQQFANGIGALLSGAIALSRFSADGEEEGAPNDQAVLPEIGVSSEGLRLGVRIRH